MTKKPIVNPSKINLVIHFDFKNRYYLDHVLVGALAAIAFIELLHHFTSYYILAVTCSYFLITIGILSKEYHAYKNPVGRYCDINHIIMTYVGATVGTIFTDIIHIIKEYV